MIPYLGYQISEKAPEFPWLKDEVALFPLSTNADKYPGMPSQMVTSVCLRSVWQDALVDYVSRMMDEFDIDGIYVDSTNMPFPCMNGLHGCEARRADGTKVPVYPLFAVRETFRRLYAVVKGKKADGIVDSHVFDCMNSAALSFATSYWNGEQLSAAPFPRDRAALGPLPHRVHGRELGSALRPAGISNGRLPQRAGREPAPRRLGALLAGGPLVISIPLETDG